MRLVRFSLPHYQTTYSSMNRFRTSYLLVLMCLGLASCRLPALKVLMSTVKPPGTTLHYDSASELELIGKTEPARDSLYWNYKWRYRDSLSEPVAVVDWQEEISSTWEILYVTNRKFSHNKKDDNFGTYGNEWGTTPEYGSCSVKLPHRPPGEDATIEKPSSFQKLLPVGFRKDAETPVENTGLHVEVDRPRPQDRELFFNNLKNQIERSRQRDVLLFVHGFNVDYQSAVTRTAQIAADLPFNGAVVSYSWPSQGGLKNYRTDGDIVDQSVPAFAEFLTEMGGRLPSDVRINIVVHSMGNRLVLRSLERLPRQFTTPKRFANIVFCAPDVGVTEFREKISFAKVVSKNVTLYCCMNDAALNASYVLNGEDRAGAPNVPIIIEGVETIECALHDTSLLGHSYYGNSSALLRDLFSILKEQTPAAERKWLRRNKIPFHGEMWIFQDFPVNLTWSWHFEERDTPETTGRVQLTSE